MDRRGFLCAAAAACTATPLAGALRTAPQIAFTFDDPSTLGAGGLSHGQVSAGILAALARHRLQAVLFVCGKRIDSTAGHRLIAAWDRSGHRLGNHSYSHLNFDDVPLAEFEADALRAEPLVRTCRNFIPLFRYPYFKEGNTAAKRDGMRDFLRGHGYGIGRATVDASDWAISARLEQRRSQDPGANLNGYRDFFLRHIWERARYYQSLAERVVLRPVRHTLLLHFNALNALFLDDLIAMFTAQGWRAVNADYAYRDPLYQQQPDTLPAGESLIWALAKATGRFDTGLRYPGEDDTYENPGMDALGL